MLTTLVEFSELDEMRFGIKSARAKEVKAENIIKVIEFCEKNHIIFLVARCPTSDIKAVHAMEKNGFELMDTLLYLRRDLGTMPVPDDHPRVIIRKVLPGEESIVSEIAKEAFSDYYGHYHADPRLNPQDCTEVYSSWAERCCLDSSGDSRVLVAELSGELVGFRAIRMNSPKQGECVLAGVKKAFNGRGIYRSFVIEAMRWCSVQGATEVINSTHIANVAVQRTCSRLGFEVLDSFYTFHKWFSDF